MADIKFQRGRQSKIDETEIENGALSFATDTRKILLDTDTDRIEFSGVGRTTAAGGEIFNNYSADANVANGRYSHAEGTFTHAVGEASHVEGSGAYATGKYTHAGGQNSTASGESSFTHGKGSQSKGYYSVAFGNNSVVNGLASFGAGVDISVTNDASAAIGAGLKTGVNNQIVVGRYNIGENTTQFEVGNGTSTNARSNAFVVYRDGRAAVSVGPTETNDVATKGYVDQKVSEAGGGGGSVSGSDLTTWFDMATATVSQTGHGMSENIGTIAVSVEPPSKPGILFALVTSVDPTVTDINYIDTTRVTGQTLYHTNFSTSSVKKNSIVAIRRNYDSSSNAFEFIGVLNGESDGSINDGRV